MRNVKVALVLVAAVSLAVLATREGFALIYSQHYHAEDGHLHENYEECLEMHEYREFDTVSYVNHVHSYLEATGGCAYGSYAHMHGC